MFAESGCWPLNGDEFNDETEFVSNNLSLLGYPVRKRTPCQGTKLKKQLRY